MIFLLGQELALHRGLGDYLLFAPQDSLISSNKGLFPFQVRRTEKPIFLILTFFFILGYLAIQLLGLSVGTIIISPFPSSFRRRQKMLINKRRNSDPAADDEQEGVLHLKTTFFWHFYTQTPFTSAPQAPQHSDKLIHHDLNPLSPFRNMYNIPYYPTVSAPVCPPILSDCINYGYFTTI